MTWRRLHEMAGLRHRSDKLLKEQDDLFGGGDDEEEGGDDEGGDEEGGDDMFGGDEEEGEDEEGEEEEEEEEADPLSAEEIAQFGPGEIDRALDGIMAQIFDDSMKSAQAKSETSAGYAGASQEDIEESLRNKSMHFLFEDDADDTVAVVASEFDMGRFCQEIARYIEHYQTLIDMEGMIFNKAKQFILNNFNEETAGQYEEQMALDHGIDLGKNYEDVEVVPIAVGAGGEGGGGGGV